VRDGDIIDLGDRAFEVLHLPGHSPGSIALFEAATKTLFSGDAITTARCSPIFPARASPTTSLAPSPAHAGR